MSKQYICSSKQLTDIAQAIRTRKYVDSKQDLPLTVDNMIDQVSQIRGSCKLYEGTYSDISGWAVEYSSDDEFSVLCRLHVDMEGYSRLLVQIATESGMQNISTYDNALFKIPTKTHAIITIDRYSDSADQSPRVESCQIEFFKIHKAPKLS